MQKCSLKAWTWGKKENKMWIPFSLILYCEFQSNIAMIVIWWWWYGDDGGGDDDIYNDNDEDTEHWTLFNLFEYNCKHPVHRESPPYSQLYDEKASHAFLIFSYGPFSLSSSSSFCFSHFLSLSLLLSFIPLFHSVSFIRWGYKILSTSYSFHLHFSIYMEFFSLELLSHLVC